jgi:hypothetical protein
MPSLGTREKVRKIIEDAGSVGIAIDNIVKKAGLSSANAVYCHIHRLRENKVPVEGIKGIYSIVKGNKTSTKVSSNGKASHRVTKSGAVHDMLLSAGSKGAHRKDLAKRAGVEEQNVPCIIHNLRSKNINVISESGTGRYYIKGKVPGSRDALVPTSSPVKALKKFPGVYDFAIDTEIIEKIKILNASDRDDYIDMIRKSKFFSMCAEALINASQFTINLKKEVDSE